MPPDVIISITIDPESEEVTKKEIITNNATIDKNLVNGKYLKNSNKATAIFSLTGFIKSIFLNISRYSALPPKIVIQKNVRITGTNNTPNKNSRILLP